MIRNKVEKLRLCIQHGIPPDAPDSSRPFDFQFNTKMAQAKNPVLAPLILSTPFCENRYQKIAALAERCYFFWRKTTLFKRICAENGKICILHKIATAFLARIRGPPSEI